MEDFRRGWDRSREDDFFFAQSVSCFFSFWSFAFNGEASVKREKGESREAAKQAEGICRRRRVFVDDEGEGATARARHG